MASKNFECCLGKPRGLEFRNAVLTTSKEQRLAILRIKRARLEALTALSRMQAMLSDLDVLVATNELKLNELEAKHALNHSEHSSNSSKHKRPQHKSSHNSLGHSAQSTDSGYTSTPSKHNSKSSLTCLDKKSINITKKKSCAKTIKFDTILQQSSSNLQKNTSKTNSSASKIMAKNLINKDQRTGKSIGKEQISKENNNGHNYSQNQLQNKENNTKSETNNKMNNASQQSKSCEVPSVKVSIKNMELVNNVFKEVMRMKNIKRQPETESITSKKTARICIICGSIEDNHNCAPSKSRIIFE